MTFIIYCLVFINAAAFMLYGIDKHKAVKGKFRIPEATLLGVAFIGGAAGAFLGMQLFRHKTRKPKFLLVPLFLILQIIILTYCIYKFYF